MPHGGSEVRGQDLSKAQVLSSLPRVNKSSVISIRSKRNDSGSESG